jgi:cyclopropane-fatty-acyl-phospholipid synthase
MSLFDESPASTSLPSVADGSVRAVAPESHSFEGALLRRLLSFLGNPPFEFVLWNGERVLSRNGKVTARVKLADRATLYGLLRDAQVYFGDAYSKGTIEIEGDLVRLLEEVYLAGANAERNAGLYGRFMEWLHRPQRNTLEASRENIHHHYDLGNEFYSLWLGSTMAYTCAYYPTPTATLDEAQVAKMHHVCRKLWLKPGETVVEAGCGWGTLALHMARHYGVKVRAFNISHEQVAYARDRAQREGLASQVEYVEDDYRNVTGTYDAFMSVGMLEHVGIEQYPQLGRLASRCLASHGRGLIHSIGRNQSARLHPWIERRIFPGARPPSLTEMMQIFEPANLSVLDVENIRLHYARTLMQWKDLFEASTDRVRSMFDEKFVRMWRLYLAGSIAGFTTGTLQLFQVVFAPASNNGIAWTRAHVYQD